MADGNPGAGNVTMTSSEFQGLQTQLNALVGQAAKLEALCETTAKGVDRAQSERSHLWVEIRGYGEKLVVVTNEIKSVSVGLAKLETTVANLEAKVDKHDDTFLRQEGAGKFAIAMTKVLWAIGGAIIAGAGALIAFLTQSGGNMPGR